MLRQACGNTMWRESLKTNQGTLVQQGRALGSTTEALHLVPKFGASHRCGAEGSKLLVVSVPARG